LLIGRSHFHSRLAAMLALAALSWLGGCRAVMDTPRRAVLDGNYAGPRTALYENMTQKRSSRQYLLDRMRVGVLTLADGYADSAQLIFQDLYEKLRTQGINKDRTVASVFTYEGVRIWKGEPFEQALAMGYYGLQQASIGAWDNARAAAQNSLFRLRDFREEEGGDESEDINTYEIARRSLIYERARAAGQSKEAAKKQADYLDNGYITRRSNFTLGYLLNAIANQQLGRDREASDNFTRLLELKPKLEPTVQAFQADDYNTVLIVSWGLGPKKVGYGPDNAFGKFVPRMASDEAALYAQVGDQTPRRHAQLLDVNRMASQHIWRNLEDIRLAKSYLGSGLLYGGLFATRYGMLSDRDGALYGGLGAMTLGALLKAGAHVDTRYCDVLPQRFYAVPVKLDSAEQTITLQVDNQPASRLKLTGLAPPPEDQAQLRLVRLVSQPGGDRRPPEWATRGQIRYGNPRTGPASAQPAPWLLGGRDLRPPSRKVLNDYQARGLLRQITLAQLRELYTLEGVTAFEPSDQAGYAGRHLLEGGQTLAAPLAGTTGFMRLFAGDWPAYRPQTSRVQALARELDRSGETGR
jgi:hypothetical protein